MRKLIVGNWKMNGWGDEWCALAADIALQAQKVNAELVVCPPFVGLRDVEKVLSANGSHVALGAQDVHHKKSGAYTGDVSVMMLKDAKCRYVIVGHSERRAAHKETDAQIAAKACLVVEYGMRPIVCVGETEHGSLEATVKTLKAQLAASLEGVNVTRGADLVVAYEPVWAIGSGKTPKLDDIGQVMAALREMVKSHFADDDMAGKTVRLLYGGSVKAANAADILNLPEVAGVLVGGASLQADQFLGIAASLQNKA